MVDEQIQASIEAESGSERIKRDFPHQGEQGEKIDVKRRKLGAVTIYDVTESELTILEKGTDASVWLNFFIGSISIAVSFLVALLTVKWDTATVSLTQIIFICITIIMFLSAIACFVFWRRGKGQHQETIKMIKERTLQENC